MLPLHPQKAWASPVCWFCAFVEGHRNGSEGWSGSSVGLEQQPSKLWVKGSNPFRITRQ